MLVGSIIILVKKLSWRQLKRKQMVAIWNFGLIFLYLVYKSVLSGNAWGLVPCAFFGVFFYSWHKEKRRLINGLLFNIFVTVLFGYFFYMSIVSGSFLFYFLLIMLLLFLAVMASAGLYILVLFLITNTVIVMKKESRNLANTLTLIFAIAIILLIIIETIVVLKVLPNWVNSLLAFAPAIFIYYFIVFMDFLSVSFLYQFNHPKPIQDYVIVLGAGLLDGERVSPLLAQRIDKAISFVKEQKAKTGKKAKLVMSGGQGADEKVSEAEAMKNYALSQGIEPSEIIEENRSTTTFENMKFSKEKLEKIFGSSDFKAIFASNNYHIFRAGLYARAADLNANGIGSKTAKYFLPNAFLREFIAVILMHKIRHFIVTFLIIGFSVLLALVNLFLVN
jgi:uncharacterized SAM-binding protein YcdF (DUF218 family)